MGIDNKRWVESGGTDENAGVLWAVLILTALALALALAIPLPEHA